jgi:hypothetical protein
MGARMPDLHGSRQKAHGPGGKAAKVEIRRSVVDALGGPARVFEAFAGAGGLYRAIWRISVASYVGCDQRWYQDERRAFVADNRRVLRAIDLSAFNLFDLDAYGSPWEQATIIAARRKLAAGERVGLVVTEGLGSAYRNGVVPHAVTLLVGARNRTLAGAALNARRADMHKAIFAELAQRMGARVERFWKAEGRTGAGMAYMGVVLVWSEAAGRVFVDHGPAAS